MYNNWQGSGGNPGGNPIGPPPSAPQVNTTQFQFQQPPAPNYSWQFNHAADHGTDISSQHRNLTPNRKSTYNETERTIIIENKTYKVEISNRIVLPRYLGLINFGVLISSLLWCMLAGGIWESYVAAWNSDSSILKAIAFFLLSNVFSGFFHLWMISMHQVDVISSFFCFLESLVTLILVIVHNVRGVRLSYLYWSGWGFTVLVIATVVYALCFACYLWET